MRVILVWPDLNQTIGVYTKINYYLLPPKPTQRQHTTSAHNVSTQRQHTTKVQINRDE
ncbi:unnamed protein product [Sphacelaria rigidula]